MLRVAATLELSTAIGCMDGNSILSVIIMSEDGNIPPFNKEERAGSPYKFTPDKILYNPEKGSILIKIADADGQEQMSQVRVIYSLSTSLINSHQTTITITVTSVFYKYERLLTCIKYTKGMWYVCLLLKLNSYSGISYQQRGVLFFCFQVKKISSDEIFGSFDGFVSRELEIGTMMPHTIVLCYETEPNENVSQLLLPATLEKTSRRVFAKSRSNLQGGATSTRLNTKRLVTSPFRIGYIINPNAMIAETLKKMV